ncbi:MAG: rRNA maturation RNase YbeY [Patescibacteria group bacterium]
MITISISVGSRYPVNRKVIRSCIIEALTKRGVVDAEVSVSVVGSRRMTWLNEHLMKHTGVTDVLSFPQKDPEQPEKEFPALPKDGPALPMELGDIVVCFPEAVREARKLGRMVDDQINFLVEHGLMHLLGFHHE